MTRGVCNFCGAWSKRSCDFAPEGPWEGLAPCEEMDPDDVFGSEEPDPDAQRDAMQDRAMRKTWGE